MKRRECVVIVALIVLCTPIVWLTTSSDPLVESPGENAPAAHEEDRIIPRSHEVTERVELGPPPSTTRAATGELHSDAAKGRVIVEFVDPDFRVEQLMGGVLLNAEGVELKAVSVKPGQGVSTIDMGLWEYGAYWFMPVCGEMVGFQHSGESRVLVPFGAAGVRVKVLGSDYELLENVEVRICDDDGVGIGVVLQVPGGVLLLPDAAIGNQVVSARGDGYAECDPIVCTREVKLRLHEPEVVLMGRVIQGGMPATSGLIQVGRSVVDYDFKGRRRPTRRRLVLDDRGEFVCHNLRRGPVYPVYWLGEDVPEIIGHIAAGHGGKIRKLLVEPGGGYQVESVPEGRVVFARIVR